MDTPSVLDPRMIPVISLTEQEKDTADAMIAEGILPPNFYELHWQAIADNVFGVGHRTDKNGPQEMGLGSKDNQTRTSVEAYRKWGKDEPDYERHLARLEKELIESQARRAAAVKAAPNPYGRIA
jgi:hypothetical protein